MIVRFKTKKLQRCFEKEKNAARKWGIKIARKFVQRIQVLQNANSVEELATFRQFEHHVLSDDRAGEHVIWLTEKYRLHFTVSEDVVTVLEVTKHYGD